ncbi:MAG: flagellar basal body P-ring protein FlgI [Thermosipho sp. (in: Bacteria)]|nr:flagellar basal body P-ring protein FlgI [Thermosipho sp. (in: thermotogales)]
MKRILIFLVLIVSLIAFSAVRIKDISTYRGARDNQLFGLGIVVGLNGTGDDGISYLPAVLNMLEHFGQSIPREDLKSKNTALVLVIADIPPYYKLGMKLDVKLYAIGNAKSIENGLLLSTDLYGPDKQVYATAEGSVLPVTDETQGRFKIQGIISNGGTIIREIPGNIIDKGSTTIFLLNTEIVDSVKVAEFINRKFQTPIASAVNSEIVKVAIPEVFENDLIGFLSIINEIEVVPNETSLVVIQKSTGNILYGGYESIKGTVFKNEKFEITITQNTSILDLIDALKIIGLDVDEILNIIQYLKEIGAINASIVVI